MNRCTPEVSNLSSVLVGFVISQKMANNFTQYELSRQFFDWSFENPDLIKPTHIAIYFFAMEHCNRLGWKDKFGLPTTMAMEAIGIKSYKTYKISFDELVEWGFFKILKKATNQYSAVVIAMVKNTKAHTKAYTKAMLKHDTKQVQSTVSINKPNNLLTYNQEPNNLFDIPFEKFWDAYGKKIDKDKTNKKWDKLSQEEKLTIMKHLPKYLLSTPEIKYRKNPSTYLNQKTYLDEIEDEKDLEDSKIEIPLRYQTPNGFKMSK